MLSTKILEKNNISKGLDEVFEQVPNWNKYYFSNYGRLIHKNSKGKYTLCKAVIMDNGYINYSLSKPARKYNGKKVRNSDGTPKGNVKPILSHRMVAQMYVTNPYPKSEYTIDDLHVHHKDHNRQNNYYQNLMWLCKTKNGRRDHDFVHTIKKIALCNSETMTYYTYKDIERLCKRIGLNILELIDNLKDKNTPKIKDGEWNTYLVNGHYVGVQYYNTLKKVKDKGERSN